MVDITVSVGVEFEYFSNRSSQTNRSAPTSIVPSGYSVYILHVPQPSMNSQLGRVTATINVRATMERRNLFFIMLDLMVALN